MGPPSARPSTPPNKGQGQTTRVTHATETTGVLGHRGTSPRDTKVAISNLEVTAVTAEAEVNVREVTVTADVNTSTCES